MELQPRQPLQDLTSDPRKIMQIRIAGAFLSPSTVEGDGRLGGVRAVLRADSFSSVLSSRRPNLKKNAIPADSSVRHIDNGESNTVTDLISKPAEKEVRRVHAFRGHFLGCLTVVRSFRR
jgi:hypothetical protein